MLSYLRSLSVRTCQRHDLARFYSVAIDQASRRKWGIAGLPRPRSILDDHDTPVDLSEDEDRVNGIRANTPPRHMRQPSGKRTPHEHKAHRETIQKNFPEGWSPPRKVSREAMEGMRQMNRLYPEQFTTPVLAEKFKISPEAVRRILKSKWEPSREKRLRLAERERDERAERLAAKRQTEREETERIRESKRAGKHDGLTLQ